MGGSERERWESAAIADLGFRLMALWFKLRDVLSPPTGRLKEVGLRNGHYVLDYGCGPGSYAVASAELVGDEGRVYALDVHPLALAYVRKAAAKKRLANVETIRSACATGLPDEHVDIALLYDVLHDLEQPGEILAEIHRVMKPDAILAVSDHHLQEDEILARVASGMPFAGVGKRGQSYVFVKG